MLDYAYIPPMPYPERQERLETFADQESVLNTMCMSTEPVPNDVKKDYAMKSSLE